MRVYGDLIEIIGTAPLQRDQFFYGRKVNMQDIPVQSHLPHISPGIGNARFGHPLMDGRQLVRRHHDVQMDIPFAVLHQRSSSRPFLRSLGSFTLSSGFASSSGGAGRMGVLLGTPSIMLQFCSVESSAVFR